MRSEFSLLWMKLRELNFCRVTVPFHPLVHAGYRKSCSYCLAGGTELSGVETVPFSGFLLQWE